MKKIALVLTSLLLFACTKSHSPKEQPATMASPSHKAMSIPEGMPSIQIDPADKACVKDSDCTLVATHCSCACGQGVAQAHAQKYTALLDNVCSKYTGVMCKTRCAGTMACKDKVCTYTEI